MTADPVAACQAVMNWAEVIDAQIRSEMASPGLVDWARARDRLIARDRATLRRHVVACDAVCMVCVGFVDPNTGDIGEPYPQVWPCPDAAAVLDYWLGETS